jgi:phosphocarrier protein
MLPVALPASPALLRVDGVDEQAAADAVAALFERRFDEDA